MVECSTEAKFLTIFLVKEKFFKNLYFAVLWAKFPFSRIPAHNHICAHNVASVRSRENISVMGPQNILTKVTLRCEETAFAEIQISKFSKFSKFGHFASMVGGDFNEHPHFTPHVQANIVVDPLLPHAWNLFSVNRANL